MNNTLNFEKGIAEINFETLKETANYQLAKGGLRKSAPVEHHQLIDDICDKASKVKDIEIKIDPIYATERQTLRVNWAGPKEECPINNHLIQRLTTRIQLINKADTDKNIAIGLSYNERGITTAIGSNIWVCSNQNVFGDNIMSSYGKNKLPFEKMMDVMNAWITNYEQKRDSDYGKITLLKNKVVDRKEVTLLYGELIEEAVLANMEGHQNSPMNVTQVGSFIRAAHSEEYEVPVGEDITAWDITQMGTSILKPQHNDYVTSYQTLNNFNNYIVDKYELN